MSDHIDIRPAADTDATFVRELYMASFPPEERRPWEELWNGRHRGAPSVMVIERGGCVAGFITVWHFSVFRYIEHFATSAECRGAGTGSAAIRAVVAADASPVVLEVEKTDANDMAGRRINFYRRNGFRVLDYPYVQPPYAPGLPSLELMLMASGDTDPAEAARTLHAEVYKVNT